MGHWGERSRVERPEQRAGNQQQAPSDLQRYLTNGHIIVYNTAYRVFVCCGCVCILTQYASQCELSAAHPLHEPHPQQSKQEVGEGCGRSQPDGRPIILYSGHLKYGSAVIPVVIEQANLLHPSELICKLVNLVHAQIQNSILTYLYYKAVKLRRFTINLHDCIDSRELLEHL